jgi:hypothetical protein
MLAPVKVVQHIIIGVSNVSADCSQYLSAKTESCQFDLHKSLRGVFLLLPSPCYAQEAKHSTPSLPGLGRAASWPEIGFPLLG